MNLNTIKEEELLNRVVDWMDPAHEISDDELTALMHDEEMKEACRQMQSCKVAATRKFDTSTPDVEGEWLHFCRKHSVSRGDQLSEPVRENDIVSPVRPHRSHRFLWGALTGMAASFLIVMLFVWWKGIPSSTRIVAFQATDSVSQVVLHTGAGESIALSPNTDSKELQEIDASFTRGKDPVLAYQKDAAQENSDENVEIHTLSTPRGKDFKIQLADGTTVWMNAESRLEYPSHFTGKERMVRLNGEAYFKVAKDAEHPFVIQTGDVRARVLGTELNVRNYQSLDLHVTLINGKVQVNDNETPTHTIELQPGEDAYWAGNGMFNVKKVDTDAYVYWRDGYFYFDDTPLVDIMQELGRWYNINVVFERKELMKTRLRFFCVRSEKLDRAVTLLNHMKVFHAELKGNTVYIR